MKETRTLRHFMTAALLMASSVALATLPIGQKPPTIELKGELGGKVSGGAWSSESLVGKVHVLFYVDPDEKELNNHASEALKKKEYPKDKFASVAVINMAASWAPNFAINSQLEKKQKEFPNTLYVKDYESVLVKRWSLKDDSNDIVAFDPSGKVIFSVDGKLSEDDVTKLLVLIDKEISTKK